MGGIAAGQWIALAYERQDAMNRADIQGRHLRAFGWGGIPGLEVIHGVSVSGPYGRRIAGGNGRE